MEFIPDGEDAPTLDVPYFGEARAGDGWQGQSTTKSFDTLKSHLVQEMARLGGVVHSVQKGMYNIGGIDRVGAQINYSIEGPNGQMVYGRIDVAALPVKKPKRGYAQALRSRQEKSLAMALYNVTQGLKAQWVLKQLNPAYIPLMPWLLTENEVTLSEAYASSGYQPQLPSPDGDTVIGEFREVEE